jgi:hypothetical protein
MVPTFVTLSMLQLTKAFDEKNLDPSNLLHPILKQAKPLREYMVWFQSTALFAHPSISFSHSVLGIILNLKSHAHRALPRGKLKE